MKRPLCLFVVSADFGEFVTATLFARKQAFDSVFLLPGRLAQSLVPVGENTVLYGDVDDVEHSINRLRPDMVVLASGYLFAVNGLISPSRLGPFVERLRARRIRVVTTDPWLGLSHSSHAKRFDIYSIRRDTVDPVLSERMNALQARLEQIFEGTDQLYAFPLQSAGARSHSFYNHDLERLCRDKATERAAGPDYWLIVLSREDYALAAGRSPETFLATLCARVEDICAHRQARVTIVGPGAIGEYMRVHCKCLSRVSLHAFCSFAEFEALLQHARVVLYWNLVSSSLLFCLYHRIPPLFFSSGHQIRVCKGLLPHVAVNVYCGALPPIHDLNQPFTEDADTLVQRMGVVDWLDRLKAAYRALLGPQAVFDTILGSG